MAITAIEYQVFRSMRAQNALPLDGDVLELGESNWYGDVHPDVLANDIRLFAPEEKREALLQSLEEITLSQRPAYLWEIAKIFWATFLSPRSMTAIDFHGTEHALKVDLNNAIDLGRQFHLVMNIGTAEHVFNIAQVFKTIHDHTLPGGMMVHHLPFTGWLDHGFYNFNSTFFWDLAAANSYQVLLFLYAELTPPKLLRITNREQIIDMAKNHQIGVNSVFFVVLRRPQDVATFCVPIQGYYAGTISREASDAWKTLR